MSHRPSLAPPLFHLAHALDGVAKLKDPFARRAAYHRAMVGLPVAADDHRAAAIAEARRRTLHLPPSSDTSVGRVRSPFQRPGTTGDLLDRAADAAAFGSLIVAWIAGYCLLCPPAHATARVPLVTDERLAALAPWAPLLIAALMMLACLWIDLGRPRGTDGEGCDAEGQPEPAPTTAPDLAALGPPPRIGDRG